eukprot:2279403-Pleurochrysis_carterae.AAC.1
MITKQPANQLRFKHLVLNEEATNYKTASHDAERGEKLTCDMFAVFVHMSLVDGLAADDR